MAFVISTHAVTAMLFPVVLEVVQAAGAKPGGRFGKAAFFALAWGASIGGIATLLGGARTPLALGLLRSATGISVSFIDWFIWSLPLVILMLVICGSLLLRIGEGTAISLKETQSYLQERSQKLGKMSSREIGTMMVVVITVILWILKGDTWGLDTIALLGVILVFTLRLAVWQEVEEDVNWGIFVMYGSAIALSQVLQETDVAQTLAQTFLTSWINNPFLGIIAIVVLVMFFNRRYE